MTTRKLTIGYLYPDIMSAYGDRGNIASIMRRCGWRGIVTEVHELRLGDPVHPEDVDIFVIGNGGESQQRLIAPDLSDVKAMAIREAVDQGAALLAVGAGYELLGRFYQPSRGVELPGAGLFDAWTIQHGAGLSAASRTITEARASGGRPPQTPPRAIRSGQPPAGRRGWRRLSPPHTFRGLHSAEPGGRPPQTPRHPSCWSVSRTTAPARTWGPRLARSARWSSGRATTATGARASASGAPWERTCAVPACRATLPSPTS
jgi:hypothetical protein